MEFGLYRTPIQSWEPILELWSVTSSIESHTVIIIIIIIKRIYTRRLKAEVTRRHSTEVNAPSRFKNARYVKQLQNTYAGQ